jgi:hypothetical protein
VIEWDIYRKFPPAVVLGLKFYYNDFGQAPYPVQHTFSKEQVDAGIEEWENSTCYELVKLFCNYRANLDWVNLSDMRLLVRKSLAHVRDVSGVEVLSENEKAHGDAVLTMEKILNPKKVEEIEEVVDKSISTEESSARNDRYFSIDEEDRDMVDTLALAISNAVGKPINSQDVLEALAQSGISIYPVSDK